MTERTPLLVEQGHIPPINSFQNYSDVLPSLECAAAELLHHQHLTLKHLNDLVPVQSSFSPPDTPSHSHKHAFLFSLLLYIAAPTDEEDEEMSQLHNMFDTTLRALTAELWTSYSQTVLSQQRSGTSPSAFALRELMWTPLVVSCDDNTNEREFVTLSKLLATAPNQPLLLEQPLVVHEVQSAWRYGIRWPPIQPTERSTMTSLLQRASSVVSPRVAHALDAIIYTFYLGTLAHIVMKGLAESFNGKDIFVIIYAIHSLLPLPSRRWSFTLRLGYLFVLWAYAIIPHGRPEPETISHAWLLAAFGWNALLLLAPITPGWVLLFHPRISLQPAVEFAALVKPVVITPLLYFLPLILFFVYLLSRVMDDPWTLNTLSATISSWFAPAPYSTREVLLILLLISILLLIFYGFASLIREAASIQSTSTSPRSNSNLILSPAATRVLLRNILVYDGRYFPAPLGILPFVFSTLPKYILVKRAERAEREMRTQNHDDAARATNDAEGDSEANSSEDHLTPPTQTRHLRRISMSIPGVRRHTEAAISRAARAYDTVIWIFDVVEAVMWWVFVWPASFLVASVWGWGWRAPKE